MGPKCVSILSPELGLWIEDNDQFKKLWFLSFSNIGETPVVRNHLWGHRFL